MLCVSAIFAVESCPPVRPSACHDSVLCQNDLKMIGKGFVLFEINSSPSAFYIIKPTCIVIGFQSQQMFKKIIENCATRRFVYVAE